MARLIDTARVVLGLALAALALNHVLRLSLPFPVGATPLAFELLEALHVSRLIYVAMGLLLVAGLALLANRFVPLALAAAMPVLVCMAYWAVVLERSPAWGALALALLGLAALLMLAHLHVYAAVLQPRPLAAGESQAQRYERRYAWPLGPLAPREAALALLPLAGAAAFYHFLLPPVLAWACLVVLLWPLAVLALRLVQGLLAKPQRGE